MHWQDTSESTLLNQLHENTVFMHMNMKTLSRWNVGFTVPRRVKADSEVLEFSCKVYDIS
jgi:hypothetical protein